jgi:hypothetical protein
MLTQYFPVVAYYIYGIKQLELYVEMFVYYSVSMSRVLCAQCCRFFWSIHS